MVNYNVNFQIFNILKIITKRSALDFLMKLFHILFDYVQFLQPGWLRCGAKRRDFNNFTRL